jgi:hypothetical protein
MDYNFYLFVQLRNVIMPTTTEYDLQYGIDCAMYEEFLTSSCNNENNNFYDCICDYLSKLK